LQDGLAAQCRWIVFAIGPNPVGFGTSQQFDLYKVADYRAAFFGAASAVAPAFNSDNNSVFLTTRVPEPLTASIFGSGLVIAFALRRKKQPLRMGHKN